MDMNQFRKYLANKQNILKEDWEQTFKKSMNALSNINTLLDRADESLKASIDNIEFYLEDFADTTAPVEKKKLSDALKELKTLEAQLKKTHTKIPVNIPVRR